MVLANESEESQAAIITAIEPQVNSAARNIKARAVLSAGRLIPGSFVKVYIEENRKGIMVPTNAIIPDALANQLVVLENGKAAFRPVETGYRDASRVEITKGIQPGDSIVVSGMLFVRPGGMVKVKKIVDGNTK
jgi:membrane fusion protein (multidrug efflux system)